ncbi:MAG TPA: NAD(P)H-binding protein [Gaiellaceae bacterium]|nr:NAD(P)H-binding protein [Gaiellaceae bacterium]
MAELPTGERQLKILVTGGTGFVGQKIVHALRAENRDVRALVRDPARATRLSAWGAELATGNLGDAESIRRAADGCTHVIHLAAIIRGRPGDFQRVMVEGFDNVLAAAQSAAVERFVLMSAIGTDESTKDTVPYYRAKWHEEQGVKSSGLEHVIFRPSFVFGRDGGALPTFIRQVKLSPVVTVIGPGRQRSQPIWVEDVASYVARGLNLTDAANRTFDLGGPDVVDWNELYRRIAAALGKRRPLVHLPFIAARAIAVATERLPGSPFSADQVTMLQGADNVASSNDAVSTFRLPLVSLDEQIRRAC